jgi:hypothetical protein
MKTYVRTLHDRHSTKLPVLILICSKEAYGAVAEATQTLFEVIGLMFL